MMKDTRPVEGKITLHGLGFLVVQLTPTLRMHVWHPDLPRRRDWRYTKVHNHRFSFESEILVGKLRNVVWRKADREDAFESVTAMDVFEHGGARTHAGSRGADFHGEVWMMTEQYANEWMAEEKYTMPAYAFHHTEVTSDDGKCVTLMRKTYEGTEPAKSLGIRQPGEHQAAFDVDFDRYQLPADVMWEFVVDALGDGAMGYDFRRHIR
jgi:hypothetical protein